MQNLEQLEEQLSEDFWKSATIEQCKEILLKAPHGSALIEKALSRMETKGATFQDYQKIYDHVNWFPKLNKRLKQIALANFKRKVSASNKNRLRFY